MIGNAPFDELDIRKGDGGDFYYLNEDGNAVNLNADVNEKLSGKTNIFSRNQLALMFLDQAPLLLANKAKLCLIMPAGPLLYNESKGFKRSFFEKYSVNQILDFTSLERFLFKKANVSTAAIFVENSAPDDNCTVSHVTVRRTRSVDERLFFEIDKYDFHAISQDSAINDKDVWKCNLFGGGRLNSFVARISQLDSIKSYAKKRQWFVCEGYTIGEGNKEQIWEADYITGKQTLPPEALTEEGVDRSQIVTETAKLFTRPRNEKLYQPPVLLIREIIGNKCIPAYVSDEYITFKHQIIGVSAPSKDEQELRQLKKSLESNLNIYKVLLAVRSSRYLVGKATSVLMKDIMSLPYSIDKRAFDLSFAENILCEDVLNYGIEAFKKGSKAKSNWQKAKMNDFEKYGDVFTKMLNSVYGKSGKSFYFSKLYKWGDFCITEFDYGEDQTQLEEETINEPTDNVKSLIHSKYGKSAYLIKIVKLYERNKIYLIKPNILRYWLRSVAIKDADEAFSDSIIAGY